MISPQKKRWLKWMATVCTIACLCAALSAQELPATEDFEPPSAQELQRMLGSLTPEQAQVLIESAARRRLELERQQVVDELSANPLYDRDAVARAKRILRQNGDATTPQDNIDRVYSALSVVDNRIWDAYRLYQAGQFKPVAESLGKALNDQDATYAGAALHLLYADSMIRLGKTQEGIDAYTNLMVNLPDRISFASAAAMRAAQAYEDTGRGLYALEMYIYAMRNYGLTMSPPDIAQAMGKIEGLRSLYGDPLGSLGKMMSDIRLRLEREDGGRDTQRQQENVVMVLEDLIQTIEERQRPKKEQRPDEQKRSQRNGQKKAGQANRHQNQQAGRPGEVRRPTVGARASSLVPGPVSRPNKLSQVHTQRESSTWAELPPRQREAIRNAMQRRLNEQRKGLVREYHRKLSESE